MGMLMVCDRKPNIEGRMDDRPLAIFTCMFRARQFLRILATNRIYARLREVC